MYSDSLNLIEEFVDDSSTSHSDGFMIERRASCLSRVQSLTGFVCSDTNDNGRCGALMEIEKKLVQYVPGSHSIDTADTGTDTAATDSSTAMENIDYYSIPMPTSSASSTTTNKVMTRRGSLGISMEDIIELTGESQGYASAAGYGHGPTKSKAWRRASLDLIISSDKQIPADAEDLDTSFHNSKSMSRSTHVTKEDTTAWASGALNDGDGSIDFEQPTADLMRSPSSSSESTATSTSQYERTTERRRTPPFDPSSPYYSSKFAASYQEYLKSLIECMDESQKTRMRVNNIKKLLKKQNPASNTTITRTSSTSNTLIRQNTKGVSYSAIKCARRKNRSPKPSMLKTLEENHDDEPIMSTTVVPFEIPESVSISTSSTPMATSSLLNSTTCNMKMPRRISRRRSSVAVQAFKNQFFPDFF